MKDQTLERPSIPLTLLTLLISLLIVFPVVWLLLSSFKPQQELFSYPLKLMSAAPTLEHYRSVIDSGFLFPV